MLLATLVVVAAYLIGSVASAVLTCRLMGLPDPRSEGSGNPGATNVLRLGGRKAALITLAGDLLKGVIPVVIAWLLNTGPSIASAAAVAAFLGHLYPLYFGFKGGKGVATAAGALLALAPWVALTALLLWLVVAVLSRFASLAGICAAAAAPILAWLYHYPAPIIVASSLMGALLIWRHEANIRRLLAGTEGRIGSKS